MKTKYFLAISCAINLALMATIILGLTVFNKSAEVEKLGEQSSGGHENEKNNFSIASNKEKNIANTENLSDKEKEKIAFLAILEHQYRKPISSVIFNYWEQPSTSAADMAALQMLSAETIRKNLLAEYGEEAINDPIFVGYFYPLGSQFEFLSSEKQIQIAIIRADFRVDMATRIGGQQGFSAMQSAEEKYWAELRGLLTEEEYFEFELRESRLAQQLRNTTIDWAEQEFRDVYQIRSEEHKTSAMNGNASISPMALLSRNTAAGPYSEEIKTRLGESRYIEYLKQQDPIYKRMDMLGKRRGSSNEEIDRAYQQYVNLSHMLISATENNDSVSQQQLERERSEVIKDIVGDDIRSNMQFLPGSSSGLIQSRRVN